ncbi:MAG: methylated-DNA--[protein]-cysteine S-methyltransferase, partial [Firmicutes bacterium]|nr:methylated-DNA--[protein]-cysteine S-methyltransferase [Bacillota bacterium]
QVHRGPTPALATSTRTPGRDPEEDRERLAALLREYFLGRKADFGWVPLDWRGYSPFTREVLAFTRGIPWGATRSYGEVAALLGRPRAARAVGRALAANRTPVVVPCHRVVRGNGAPGGFTGGIGWKERLLEGEGGPRRTAQRGFGAGGNRGDGDGTRNA